MRYLGFLLVSVLLISSVRAQPPVQPPGPPPSVLQQIKVVQGWSNDKGTVSLITEVVEYVIEVGEQEVIVIENGVQKMIKQNVNVFVPVMKTFVTPFVLKEGKATAIDGTPLSGDEVFQRLPVGSAVLVLPAGYQLPHAHKRLFSKEAVILIAPTPVAQ